MEEAKAKYKILIVDDSDFSRSNIAEMLNDDRFQIIGEASNAKEAMATLKDRTAHVAIIDVVMPGISGLELAETMSQNFPDTAIIMISSLAHESIIIDAISMGASDFIQKPFKKADLINSLEKILINIEDE